MNKNKIVSVFLALLVIGSIQYIVENFSVQNLLIGLILAILCAYGAVCFWRKSPTNRHSKKKKRRSRRTARDRSSSVHPKQDSEALVRPSRSFQIDRYVILDTETTGFGGYDEIVEIGAIKYNGDEKEIFHTYCKPTKRIRNSEFHGITDEDVKDYKNAYFYMDELKAFLGDLPIFMYNAPFDYRMLSSLTEINNPIVDVLQISKKYENRKSHALENVKKSLHIDRPSHNAVDDCETTHDYLNYLIEKHQITKLRIDANKDYSERRDEFLDRISFSLLEEMPIIQESNALANTSFCFTGSLEQISRLEAGELVLAHGGLLKRRIVLSLNYLVVGKDGLYREKYDKALRYNERPDVNIKIIGENEFLEMIDQIEKTAGQLIVA